MNEPQLSTNEFHTILNLVFKPDTPQQKSEDALKLIEENFIKQQNLVPIIVDFYINSDFAKPVIELLCKVPDILLPKIFDKLNEHLKATNPKLDKIMALLISMAYKTKSKPKWCSKLLQHPLFALLMRILNAKSNTPNSTNEYITTQTCLLFAILMNTTPAMIANHSEIFQIVFNSYKVITSNEQQQHYKKHYDSNANNTVKWSMKLFFYIFYGLFPHLFLQCLRKKENQTINKDAINSLLNRLRMHPALLKEKSEYTTFTAQLTKPFDDTIFEWNQYCLDEGYTNVSKSALDATSAQHRSVLHRQYSVSSDVAPPSPTYIQPSGAKSIQESSEKQRHPSSSASSLSSRVIFQPQKSSIPSTPLNDNNELKLALQIFNFPSNESLLLEQQEAELKKPIKNLTAQFMQSPEDKQQDLVKAKQKFAPLDENIRRKIEQKNLKQANSVQTNTSRLSYFGNDNFANCFNSQEASGFQKKAKNETLSRHKSLSDSNLDGLSHPFHERRPKAQTAIGDPLLTMMMANDEAQLQQPKKEIVKTVRSEMRDPSLIFDPLLTFYDPTATTTAQTPSGFYTHSIASASESNVFGYSDLLSRQISRQPNSHYESTDILSSYLSRGDCNESTLKREYETLCHELMYERYLREKYESLLNKAFSLKIENEQLLQEKADLELLYRKAVESQQELDSSKNKTLHQQLIGCKQELHEKAKSLESKKKRECELETKLRELQQQFDDQSAEYRKLQRKYELTEQSLENEKLANKQYQNETTYIKSLRNTVDDLRKKLLIMTKISSRFPNGCQSISNAKHFQLNTLYNEEIDELNNKLKDSQLEYIRLLSDYKAKDAKMFDLESELANKNKQIDDLNQQIYNSIAQINANLYKNNSRVYKSVLAVNARLESEIIKLKSEKSEISSQLEELKTKQQPVQ